MNFDLNPPSPSLSPSSKIRFYMEQTEKAHEIIDQLETLLQEKEKQKQLKLTIYNGITIPPLRLNQKSPSISSSGSKSYVPTPQQYSTPRDARTRLSMGSQASSKFFEEMKIRHNDLIQQFKEDSSQQEYKNKEISEQIAELKTELMYSQEKQTITQKEKKQTQYNLEILENEIERIKLQLQKSKEQGQNIQLQLQLLKQQDISEEEKDSDTQFQQQKENYQPTHQSPINKPRSKSKIKNSSSHRKLIISIKKEIDMLEQKKDELLNQVSQFDEKEVFVQEDNLQDPIIIEVNEDHNYETLEDLRIATESVAQKDIQEKDVESKKKPKQRGCDSCLIF